MGEMKHCVRIYSEYGKKVNHLPLWKRLFTGRLAPYIVKDAKNYGIEQAIVLRVSFGYLRNRKIEYKENDRANKRLPQCIELIDTKERLEDFLENNRHVLSDRDIVIYQELMEHRYFSRSEHD